MPELAAGAGPLVRGDASILRPLPTAWHEHADGEGTIRTAGRTTVGGGVAALGASPRRQNIYT